MVSKILRHKYEQGWKFLTAWQGFPISSATWNPPKHFQLAEGKWNAVFEDYCRKVGISYPPGRKMHDTDTPMQTTQIVHNFPRAFKNDSGKKENCFFQERAKKGTRQCNGKDLGEVFACSSQEYKREVLRGERCDETYSWKFQDQNQRTNKPFHYSLNLYSNSEVTLLLMQRVELIPESFSLLNVLFCSVDLLARQVNITRSRLCLEGGEYDVSSL